MAEDAICLQKIALENTIKNTDNGGHFGDLINNEIETLDVSAVSVQINELTLIDVGSVDEEENMWLYPSGSPLTSGTEKEWLKGELDLTGVTVEKNTLVDMLDDLSRKSYNSPKSPANSETSERSVMSPSILPSVHLCSQPVSSTPTSSPLGCKLKSMSPKTFRGGRIIAEEADRNSSMNDEDGDEPLNATFKIKENMNVTLDKASSPSTGLNSTFNKDSPVTGLNSTFSKDDLTRLNSTFSKEGNATFNAEENMNATFEKNDEKYKFDMKATDEEEEMSSTSSNNEGEGRNNSPMDDGIAKPSDSSENFKSIVQDNSHASPRGLDTNPDQPETQLFKIRQPPSSRLQVPPSFRFKTHLPTTGPSLRPAIRGGLIRSGLRPPTSVPRKISKSPTFGPKTGLRPPSVVPGKSLRLPTPVQVRQVRPLTSATSGKTSRPDKGSRPSTSAAVSGLKKPSGIVRMPGGVTRPSGLARSTGTGIAMPSNARQVKTAGRDVPGRTG